MDNLFSSFTTLQITLPATHILQITLNRPTVRNAINSVMMRELYELWHSLLQDYGDLRCVILTGAGDKAFCAGADLKERQNLDLATWRQQHIALEQAMLTMIDCPLPIIAAINGAAFGGGLELALAADFIYAAPSATFAQSEVKLGIMPGAMGTQQLSRAVGLRRAKELSFTGQAFNAEQAYAWGLVNHIIPTEQLLTAVLIIAQHIAENAPMAVRAVKKAIQMSTHTDYKTGYAAELEAYYRLLPTQDRIEGISAFNEKRKPSFKNQ
jgi:enoyl-CoA hydratase